MGNIDITRKTQIIRVQGETCEIREDLLIAEYSFTLYGNGRFLREFNCTPCSLEELEELSVGALFTSGMIRGREDILSIDIDARKGEGHVSFRENGKSLGRVLTDVQITLDEIYSMMSENLTPTRVFAETGGVHMVSLYDLTEGRRLLKKEDAARHNAVDKVIGAALCRGCSFAHTALVLSGRVSLEILSKAETAGIPVVLSKAAPTDQSVEAAGEAGITLIGFIREGRMNIYTHPQRVLLPAQVFAQIARDRRTETVRKSRYL